MATGWSRGSRVLAQKWLGGVGSLTQLATPFAALCTANPLDDGSANVPAATIEPTSTGSYARQAITWNSTVSTPSNDASAQLVNSGSISWTSTAAFSTGATALSFIAIYNTSTLATVAEANFQGRASITVPQAVNASGITLTIASGGLVMGMISA